MTFRLYKLGRYCATHPTRTLVVWLLLAVAIIAGNRAFGAELSNEFSVPGVDSQEAIELLERDFPANAGEEAQVVVQAPAGTLLTDPAQSRAVDVLVAQLLATESIVSAPRPQPGVTISPDATIGLIIVNFDPALEASSALIDDLESAGAAAARISGDGVLTTVSGGGLYFSANQPETGVGEAAGLITAVIILLLAFGSITAMGLPVGTALFGLAIGIGGVLGLVATGLAVPEWAPSLAGMIGLGVGIDYALFVVTRFREGLTDGLTVIDAAARATATAGQAVIFAGGTVVIAILGLAIAGIPFVTAAGVAVSVIVALMVLAAITVLPALLGWSGYRVVPRRRRAEVRRQAAERGSSAAAGAAGDGDKTVGSGGWERWGSHVSRHSRWYLVGGLVVLLTLTAPILRLELGFPDQGNEPLGTTQRTAYDLLTDGFGPGFNGPLLIAVDTTVLTDGAEYEMARLVAAVAADGGIVRTTAPQFSPNGRAAIFQAFSTTSPQDAATVDTIARLRAEVFPYVLSNPDAAHIGGSTAGFTDIAGRVEARLPFFIAGVIALSFLLLMIVFRSIYVPIKAAILNLLSIGAAYGVLVAVFQWGWGLSLIGLSEPVPIVSFLPMMMFAVLFGLSMDYEVFLLSRVREEFLRDGDNSRSVIAGISSTARVITSAALIMIAVFGGFVTNPDPVLKMMGLGLATAIFVDASLVRVVLVPAWMHMLGDRNWWFPKSLSWLPRLEIEGESRLPPREYVSSETGEDATARPVSAADVVTAAD
ncbi:MAG TPA: hypothetical protein DEP66_00100 [Acidimicrobiaceae bacterium]|nr:hypothetical protein [Acidimicrobiaceae bacterium]HCB36651.1 hypothetical protein [Acidimicrobiaceae bacterium]